MDNLTVQNGGGLFHSTGCASCHKPITTTGEHEISRLEGQVIRPYTDLLLHDMGEGLSGRSDFLATKQEWRTEPLWTSLKYPEVVLWHGGEAEKTKQNDMNLTKKEKDALILFVNQL